MSTISTTISGGVNLTNPAYASPLTISATGAVVASFTSASAVYGPSSGGPWRVVNHGSVEETGSNSFGINLTDGGFVSNGGGVTASFVAINITGLRGTVVNSGTVDSPGSNGTGIILHDGGSVSNSGDVTGAGTGIFITGSAGAVNNLGTVDSEAPLYRSGVYLGNGGRVTNGSHSDTSALIEAQWTGVDLTSGGSLINFGTIESLGTMSGTLGHKGLAVFMPHGGDVVNHGLIEAANFTAIYIGGSLGAPVSGAVGTVTNSGTVESTGRTGIALDAGGVVTNSGRVESDAEYKTGVYLNGGGKVFNGPSGATGALIEAAWLGVNIFDGGTLANYGTVESTGTAAGTAGRGLAVFMPKGGDIVNHRLIEATYFTAIYMGGSHGAPNPGALGSLTNFGTVESGSADAIGLAEGGVVVNGATGDTSALIEGGTNSVAIYIGASNNTINAGATATLTNFGTIENNTTMHSAVILAAGGTLHNNGKKALVEGGLNGFSTNGNGGSGGPGTLVNSGTVEGTTGSGVRLGDGGIVSNTGLIEGATGITVSGGDATVTNAGKIESTGTTTAISFAAGTTDLLVVAPGAVFVGNVLGPGAGGTLELARGKPGSLAGLGTNFQSFGTIKVDLKASWTLSGDASGSAFVNDGKVLVGKGQSLVFGTIGEDPGKRGTIDLVGTGAAEFKVAVDAGQSLLFTGKGGFLTLDDPATFAATIKGFKKGDTIDLAAVTADAVSFSKGKLTITDAGTPVATLALKGHYKTREFVVTSEGAAGTEITIGAPATGAAPHFLDAGPSAHRGGSPGAEGAIAGGGGGSGDGGGRIDGFVPFGAGAVPLVGIAEPSAAPPWATDPFHFWTIQG